MQAGTPAFVYGVLRRKKRLLLDAGSMTWFWRLVRLSTGSLVTSAQFAKSEVCCRTKLVEEISQENERLLFVGVSLNVGDGVACEVQIPPLVALYCAFSAAAKNLFPSAEEATAVQFVTGAIFETQLIPPLVEE